MVVDEASLRARILWEPSSQGTERFAGRIAIEDHPSPDVIRIRTQRRRASDLHPEATLAAARSTARPPPPTDEGLLREWLKLGLEADVHSLGVERHETAPSPMLEAVLGDACVALGRDDEAVEWYRRAAGSDPAGYGDLLERCASLHAAHGRWAEALDALQESARLSTPGARRVSGVDETIAAMRRFVESEPRRIDWSEGDLLVSRPLQVRLDGDALRFLMASPAPEVRLPVRMQSDHAGYAVTLEGAIPTPEWARFMRFAMTPLEPTPDGAEGSELQLAARGSTNLPMIHMSQTTSSEFPYQSISLPEGVIRTLQIAALPALGMSGMRVEAGWERSSFTRRVPAMPRGAYALSLGAYPRDDNQWSTFLRSEMRLDATMLQSGSMERAALSTEQRVRFARERAGGLLVQERYDEAAAAFEALGDDLHAAFAHFRGGRREAADERLRAAFAADPFETVAATALAYPLLDPGEREWLRAAPIDAVALARDMERHEWAAAGTAAALEGGDDELTTLLTLANESWATDWTRLYARGSLRVAALELAIAEEVDYAAMRLRYDGAPGDGPVAVAAAASFMQTWSARIDPNRAAELLERAGPPAVPAVESGWATAIWEQYAMGQAQRVERLRADIDLETGRTGAAREAYRRLVERAGDAASRQSLWWQLDEAEFRERNSF